MRPPSAAIVVDASIIIAAARGRSSGAILAASRTLVLLTTDRALHESRRRIELGLRNPDLIPVVDGLAEEMTVVTLATLLPLLRRAEIVLRDAPASLNGSTNDAHLLALAWNADADIWSSDRDFAGTGVASWSTPNLMRALVSKSTMRR